MLTVAPTVRVNTPRSRTTGGVARLLPIALALAALVAVVARAAGTPVPRATFVDEKQCGGCHQAEQRAWAGSHHRLAMQEATSDTVLGDFSDVSLVAHGVRTRFFRRGGKFFVNTDGPDGRLADFEVAYTFGIDPLQQYLIALPGGRLQAFTIAWDVKHKRWFDLYPQERIDYRDPLHWTRLLHNWNLMCAECHSTDVHKNYDATSNTYHTAFAQIDVGCQACHGPASRHVESLRSGRGAKGALAAGFDVDLAAGRAGAQIQMCARCHSRRAAFWDEYHYGAPLLDTHLPALPEEPSYFADGQIHDEVYEYGSFLQSKMHAKGVRCTDCHEAHSLRRYAPGNALCTACHNATGPSLRHTVDVHGLKPKNYDSPIHHFHTPGSPGAQCVACHMPERTYMVIDARRDHSLRIPRPDLSIKMNVPNACVGCHSDRNASWAAAAAVARWYGSQRHQEHTYGETLWAGEHREPGAAQNLADAVRNPNLPSIIRATAFELLRRHTMTSAAESLVRAGLADSDPLVRLAALGNLEPLPSQLRTARAAPLLADPVRGVRIEAARLLADTPPNQLPDSYTSALDRALAEYEAAQRHNADDPGSHLNLGNLYASRGDSARAETEYRNALRLDDRFAPAYANLADLKAGQGLEQEAERALRAGLALLPREAALHHALGLALSRQRRASEALVELRRATELAPNEPRYVYVYGVATHDLQGPVKGLAILESALRRFPNDHDLLASLAAYARDAGDSAKADAYAQRLHAIENIS